jgi:hypothetical protein
MRNDGFDRYRDKIDPAEVPEHLRDLIDAAYIWGIGDDVVRDQFEERVSLEDKRALQEKLRGRTADVNAWLNSFPDGSVHPGAFSNFTDMLQALAEMDLWPDPPE